MAFKSNYPWLKDMKEKTKKNGNVEITKITVLGGSPIGGRTDINFTGYGEDGRLQPSKPTGMFNAFGGPVMEHEGEARIEYPDGEKTVIPASQLNQDILQKMEGGMRGAQGGGTFQPPDRDPRPKNQTGGITPPSNYVGDKKSLAPIGIEPIKPTTSPVNVGPQTTPVNIEQGMNIPAQTTAPVNIAPQTTPVDIGQGINIPMQTTAPVNIAPQTTPINIQQPGTGTTGRTLPEGFGRDIGVRPLGDITDRPLGDVTPITDIRREALQRIGERPPVTTTTPDKVDEGSVEYQQALQRQKRYAEGISPVDQKIREEERMRLAGEESAARMALEQYGAQMGLSDREMLTEQAMLGRDFGAQEVALMASLRKGEADRAFQASMALPGQVLAGMQFKLSKEQWDKQFDFENKKWEEMTDFEKEKWNWDKETWQKEYDLAKEQWDKNFEENKSQWQQMFDFGKEQWDYGKKLDFVNTLVQQGGAENYAQASEMLKSMYGGSIDFSNALTAENQANFFNGMDLISSSIASGLDWEDTLKSLKENGVLDRMGMTEGDLKSMYDNMKLQSDPLYQAITMADTWLEQGWVDQEEYDDFVATVKYGLTNHEGFDISDGFMLIDNNTGNEVGFFTTQEEMEEYMRNNPGNYSANKVKNHISITTEETTEEEEEISEKDWNEMGESEQNEYFLDSVPQSMLEDWDTKEGFQKWIKADKPQTWDEYQKNIGGDIPDYTQTLINKYSNEGWSDLDFSNMNYNTAKKKLVNETVDKARDEFTSGADNVHSYTRDELENMSHEDLMREFKTGDIISVDGRASPVVIGRKESGYYIAYDLETGATIWVGYQFKTNL